VNKKPEIDPDVIVSFLMKRAWQADCLLQKLAQKRL
jgi:hypothetical protein